MQTSALLDNVSIVLVDTKTPANIGSTARAMMNMGLAHLKLVNPPDDRDGEAVKLSAGAHVILEKAKTFPSLVDAVADHGLVVGTSRHPGRLRQNIRPPHEMAKQIVQLLGRNRVAIVFGNEVNGLDNEALSHCQEIIAIPASDDFRSLNLSHAVMIIAYELFLASCDSVPDDQPELARADELERFFQHLQATLQRDGFFGQEHPDRLMFAFRQIFGRSRLASRDVSILRGVLSLMDRHKC